jgi:hypothetical protein
MRHYIYLVLALTLAASGCSSAYIVKKNGQKTDGIPFYTKVGACLHTSVYAAPYFRLTLKKAGDEKTSDTLNLSESALQSPEAQDVISLVRDNPPLSDVKYESLRKMWSALKTSSGLDPYSALCIGQSNCTDKLAKYLVSNTGSPAIFVDYKNTYTMNARTPFAGTVSADTTLAEDGTLSKSSAQIENKTFETVMSLFPVSELIKSAAGFKATLVAGEEVQMQLAIERRILKLTRSHIDVFEVGCPTNGIEVTKEYDFKLEDVGAEAAKSGEDKSEDNTITVNGTVKLPKQAAPGEKPANAPDNSGAANKKPDEKKKDGKPPLK